MNKKLAIDNDYFVCVLQEGDNVLKVLYPNNIHIGLNSDVYTYYFYKNELFVTLDKKSKSITYLDYELRPFITSHILLTSITRNIPPSYIRSYNTKNEESKLADLLPAPTLRQKESQLVSKLLKFIDTKQYEGTDMIRNIQRFNSFCEEKFK